MKIFSDEGAEYDEEDDEENENNTIKDINIINNQTLKEQENEKKKESRNLTFSELEPSGNNGVTEAKIYSETCGPNRGGCDHLCRLLQYPNKNEPIVECSCFKGFILDPTNMKKCNGKLIC